MNKNNQERPSPMRTVKAVLITVALMILVTAAIQNSQVVVLHFLIWEFSISQILLLPLAALMGFVVGLIAFSMISRRGPGRKE